MERNNCRQRHRLSRFKRKSIVVSRSLQMVELSIALFARFRVNGNVEEISSFFLLKLSKFYGLTVEQLQRPRDL